MGYTRQWLLLNMAWRSLRGFQFPIWNEKKDIGYGHEAIAENICDVKIAFYMPPSFAAAGDEIDCVLFPFHQHELIFSIRPNFNIHNPHAYRTITSHIHTRTLQNRSFMQKHSFQKPIDKMPHNEWRSVNACSFWCPVLSLATWMHHGIKCTHVNYYKIY